jgi:hypothetical protein
MFIPPFQRKEADLHSSLIAIEGRETLYLIDVENVPQIASLNELSLEEMSPRRHGDACGTVRRK